jgi:16S rRNA (cytidine1402-2'-O)-methyltransferase
MELATQARSDANFTRGEITVVVEGAPRATDDAAPRAQLDSTLTILLSELAPSKAAALAARLTGAKRNDAYARALELSKGAAS